MANFFDQFDEGRATTNFFDRFDRPEAALDFEKPIEDLRAEIEKLPETRKQAAYQKWAEKKVAKERSLGLGQLPSAERGIPLIGGLLDEATAAIRSGIHSVSGGNMGRPYDESLALERERQRQAEAANPALAIGGQLAAGVATGGPIFSRIPTAATLVGRIGQGAAIGAPLGYAETFTRGEGGPEQRHERGTEGAKFGAGIGAVLPGAAAGATRLYGAVAEHLGPTFTRWFQGVQEAAEQILANRIRREGSSAAAKRLDLQRGQTQSARLHSDSYATLPETIADTSDYMQRTLGTLYRQGGEAGNFIRQNLEGRQRGPANRYAPRDPDAGPQGQIERILDATERGLLLRTSNTARATARQIEREQAIEGRQLYHNAYENGEPFDLSEPLIAMGLRIQQYPAPFAARLNRARNLFVRSGTRQNQNQPWWVDTVRRFDASKKALDDMIEAAQRGGQNNLARELTQFKHDLLRRVHATDEAGNPTINLAYQEARQSWGSAAENREAIELGRAAMREGSEVSVEQFRELTRGQQQLFRIGFMESLRNRLAGKRPGNDVTLLFEEQRVQEIMREIIPRSQGRTDVFHNRPERFGDVVNREQRMVQTRNQTYGNSPTAQRGKDDIEFTGDALAGMWNRFRQSPSLFNMGLEAIGAGIQKVFGYNQRVALQMARMLLETDPTQRNQILRRLARRGGPDRFAAFAETVDRAGVSLIGAAQAPLAIEDKRGAR